MGSGNSKYSDRRKLLGTSKSIYKTKNNETGEKFAVKYISMEKLTQEHQEEALVYSQKYLNLDHPNINTQVDTFIAPGKQPKLAIIQPLRMQSTLKASIDQQKHYTLMWKPEEIMNYFLQICFGLDYLHQQGLVHGNLKSSNVMFMPDAGGRIRISDYGISQNLIKKSEYLSPEQIAGKPIDKYSDIYSLGVIMNELFSLGYPQNHSATTAHYTSLINYMLDPNPTRRPTITSVFVSVSGDMEKWFNKQKYLFDDEKMTFILQKRAKGVMQSLFLFHNMLEEKKLETKVDEEYLNKGSEYIKQQQEQLRLEAEQKLLRQQQLQQQYELSQQLQLKDQAQSSLLQTLHLAHPQHLLSHHLTDSDLTAPHWLYHYGKKLFFGTSAGIYMLQGQNLKKVTEGCSYCVTRVKEQLVIGGWGKVWVVEGGGNVRKVIEVKGESVNRGVAVEEKRVVMVSESGTIMIYEAYTYSISKTFKEQQSLGRGLVDLIQITPTTFATLALYDSKLSLFTLVDDTLTVTKSLKLDFPPNRLAKIDNNRLLICGNNGQIGIYQEEKVSMQKACGEGIRAVQPIVRDQEFCKVFVVQTQKYLLLLDLTQPTYKQQLNSLEVQGQIVNKVMGYADSIVVEHSEKGLDVFYCIVQEDRDRRVTDVELKRTRLPLNK